MSKKNDVLDRISGGEASRRRAEVAPPRGKPEPEPAVARKEVVVRRRPSEAAPAPAPEPVAPPRREKDVVVRRRAPEPAPVVAPPAPVAPPVVARAPERPAPAPVVAAPAEPAPAVVAPVAVQPEVVVEARPAPAVEAPAPVAPVESAPVAVAVAPEPVVEAPAAPAAPPAPAVRQHFRGLGSAVVVPPPGYDPANPEAFRARQRRDATPGATPSGRRAAYPGNAAPAPVQQPAPGGSGAGGPGDARNRRGRMAVDDGMRFALRPKRRKKKGLVRSISPQPKAAKRKIRVDGTVTVSQLAHELSLKAPVLIKKLMEMGSLVTVNDLLDLETATLIANEFDYEVENVAFDESAFLQHVGEVEEEEGLETRPPVVTIMGHVDHGKTTLLDTIRKAKVASGEAGGITQHIGAYQVETKGRKVTFLDTPGHAAFSAMRARGASVTDIVVLVVAADDGVQPQTLEAINHAKAADVPIVVAVNKIDKPGVNPDAIRTRLSDAGLVPDDWGGDTMFVNVSALKSLGIDELLEAILLQADVLELTANADRPAEGSVIEAKMERGRGPVASVLVETGTLKAGDHVVLGTTYGKVRSMTDHTGKSLKGAGPSTPVELFGLSDLPNVGDRLAVVKNEKNARTLAEHRADEQRLADLAKTRRRTLDDLRRIAGEADRKVQVIVLKADVQGSLEALRNALMSIQVPGCDLRIVHDGVGPITESDVSLVAAGNGLLLGFNVKVDARARKVADEVGVKPELFEVIYDLLGRVEGALKGMLDPVYEEVRRGTAEVRAIFNISKTGMIAGCYIMDGVVARSHVARLLRDNREIWKGDVATLKRFKDDVRDVAAGYECGIGLKDFRDIQVGDLIETFEMVRTEAS